MVKIADLDVVFVLFRIRLQHVLCDGGTAGAESGHSPGSAPGQRRGEHRSRRPGHSFFLIQVLPISYIDFLYTVRFRFESFDCPKEFN